MQQVSRRNLSRYLRGTSVILFRLACVAAILTNVAEFPKGVSAFKAFGMQLLVKVQCLLEHRFGLRQVALSPDYATQVRKIAGTRLARGSGFFTDVQTPAQEAFGLTQVAAVHCNDRETRQR